MMPREVPGGIVRRWYCDNPYCRYPFHETRWCPEQRAAALAAPPLLPAPPASDHESPLWELRAERLRRAATAAEEAERARVAQPPARPDPGYGWLLVFVPVALLLIAVMLGLLLVR